MDTTKHTFLFAFTGIFLAVMLAAVGVMPARAGGGWMVTTPADTFDGVCDGDCSLRDAIFAAAPGDTINFAPDLAGQVIRLYDTLYIDFDLTIDGSDLASPVTVSGDANNSGLADPGDVLVFSIGDGVSVSLRGLTISGGYSQNDGGGGITVGIGSNLSVEGCTFSGNSAAAGGAIYSFSTLQITGSTFRGNRAASGNGGAIFQADSATVSNSTFVNNISTAQGGGIFSSGPVFLYNNTFSGNQAIQGGGISAVNSLLYNNNIIANSTGGGDCYAGGGIAGNTNNLVEDGSPTCMATLSGDPKLGALADNGGPTQSMALLAGSPALAAGNAAICAAPPVGGVDQRGWTRGTPCDIGAFEQHEQDFIITVKTDNLSFGSSTATQFTIPTTGGGYNYNVDCNNDGTYEASGQAGNYTCNYATLGTYTVRIQDNAGDGTGFPRIFFNYNGDRLKLLTIEQWGTGKWTSMENAFGACTNLTVPAADNPDLSEVTSLRAMFDDADAFNEDIGDWDVSHVTDMSRMFAATGSFNQDISTWNTANVTDMSEMFRGAQAFNQDISGWNTSSVTNMRWMFFGARDFNQDLNTWDTAKVTNMESMFALTQAFDGDISGWDTRSVTTMKGMFANALAFNQNIGGWDTHSVTDMSGMFTWAVPFDQNLGGWNVTALTDATDMFKDIALSTANYDALLIGWEAQALKPGVNFHGGGSKYCTGEAARGRMISGDFWTIADGGKDCSYLLNDFVITVQTDNEGLSADNQFTIPTTGGGYDYNVDCDDDGTFEATGQTGDYTCNYAAAGTYTVRIRDNSGAGTGFPRIFFNSIGDRLKLLTIQQWGTGKWTSMAHAFDGCSNLTMTAADRPNLSGVTDMSSMFAGATVFNGDISEWTVASVQNMSAMFKDAVAFNQPVGEWDMSSVTDLSEMFFGAQAFNQPLAYWDTSEVTNMSAMFMRASSFNQDIGGWDTAGVTDMSFMFDDADDFNQDISGWNTANVTDMQYMFYAAAAFNQDIGGWNTAKVTQMHAMFTGSSFDQDLGGWDVGALTDAVDMFYEMTLSTANYDALLIGWGAQVLQPGVTFNGGDSKYCAGADARARMIADDGWTITDGGEGCASADLAIRVQRSGQTAMVFTVTITNLGPGSADGARVQDKLNAEFMDAAWTCAAESGAACAHASGTGNVLDETIPTLPSGGQVVFVFQASPATLFIKDSNTATVTAPAGVDDPNPANNTATIAAHSRLLIPICSLSVQWQRPVPQPPVAGAPR